MQDSLLHGALCTQTSLHISKHVNIKVGSWYDTIDTYTATDNMTVELRAYLCIHVGKQACLPQ